MSDIAILSSLRSLSLPKSRCAPGSRALNASARPRTQVYARAKSTDAGDGAKGSEVPGKGASMRTGPVTHEQQETLPWAEYLTIRKKKRRWETVMTIPFTLAGFAGGVAYFGNLDVDPTKPIFNIDPMFVYGFATLGCAGLGYLFGPIVGSSLWRFTHRRAMRLIEERDRQFHNHIIKNRVDPAAQSATNPVPDYYGEKIGSLHAYRQWLRDQAKFRRKAFLPED